MSSADGASTARKPRAEGRSSAQGAESKGKKKREGAKSDKKADKKDAAKTEAKAVEAPPPPYEGQMLRLAEVLGANAFEGDAHSLLIAIYKDESRPIELRLEAAKAAIRFEKPALAALDAKGTIENVHYAVGEQPVTEDEWIEQHISSH